ncbi:MAG TPA: O-antigen ligase family protein [Bryobacteraceae bacterium]|nr:O-antigen ligase family protein [Bryobacteraceae bacterium]
MLADAAVPARPAILQPRVLAGAGVLAASALAAAAALLVKSATASLAILAAGAFGAFLIAAPTYWLALLLVGFIPFHTLITQYLGGFESSSRQWFAVWKEALLAVGTLRAIWDHPNRRAILHGNRWVLGWSTAFLLIYAVTLLRYPGLPAIFAISLETKFIAVMVFFLFLNLDAQQAGQLLRLIVWSAGLISVYGLIQYFWDYDRLLPLVYSLPDLNIGGAPRLYSYLLNPLEPAFDAAIGILILFTGAGRFRLRAALPWLALLAPCLLLTYTRSALIGLAPAILIVCIAGRERILRYSLIATGGLLLACGIALFGGNSIGHSTLAQRLQSIVTRNDDSSYVHKERMDRAMDTIRKSPWGVGLGGYGTVQARFSSAADADYAEDCLLQVTVETGLIGGLVYLGLTVAVLLTLALRLRQSSGEVRLVCLCVFGVFVALTIAGAMLPIWEELSTLVFTWALVGISLSLPFAAPSAPSLSDRT